MVAPIGRCKIPDGIWFAGERIKIGQAVYIANKRLHIIKALSPSAISNAVPCGVYFHDKEKVSVVTRES